MSEYTGMYTLIALVFSFVVIYVINLYGSFKKKKGNGGKQVPVVSGSLPFVGHGIKFGKDIIGFIRNAQKKYGDVFRLNIFNKSIIVICNHDHKREYFNAVEEDFSLYDVLTKLFLADAFSDKPENLTQVIQVLKKTIKVQYESFVPKIKDEAQRLVKRMKMMSGCVKISDELIKFIACTSARCFIGLELKDAFYSDMMQFTHFLNRIVVLTYFVPLWLLRLTVGPIFKYYRNKIINNYLLDEIQRYRTDPKLKESLVIRGAIDFENNKLTDSEIGEIIICLLYVSSENTALGLAACIFDLSNNEGYWERLADEIKPCLENNDVNAIYSMPLLDACMQESFRTNTHVFAIQRRPKKENAIIGGYDVSDVDSVALCQPMLMLYENSKFSRPLDYYPERFLGADAEGKGSLDIILFGFSHHLCPGKGFAIYEIKMALALIVSNFNKFTLKEIGKQDYFSPSAFAERRMTCLLNPKPNELFFNESIVNTKIDGVIVKHYKSKSGHDVWFLKNYIKPSEQKELFKYTIDLSKGSDEHFNIKSFSLKGPCPITFHRLLYTGGSNCIEPTRWYKIAYDIWDLLKKLDNFDAPDRQLNSFYAQLFHSESALDMHKDQDVDWGISISIGATAEFMLEDKSIFIESGDVMVANFNKINHGVKRICNNTQPGWMDDPDVETFGRARLGIQIREVLKFKEDLMEMKDFLKLINYKQ